MEFVRHCAIRHRTIARGKHLQGAGNVDHIGFVVAEHDDASGMRRLHGLFGGRKSRCVAALVKDPPSRHRRAQDDHRDHKAIDR